MTKVYQIANGRWQITAEYAAWKVLPRAFISAILWRSFETREAAEQFAMEAAR